MQQCPRCHARLTLLEAIKILHGTGFTRMVMVRPPGGEIGLLEAGKVNPNTVEVLE